MSVLSDGYSVLLDQWQLIAISLMLLLFGLILIWSVLKMIFGVSVTSDEYLSLGLAGWIVPVVVLSTLWFLLGFQALFLDVLIAAITFALLVLLIFPRAKKEAILESQSVPLALLLLLGVFIFLRLVFVSQAILPLYFDSAQHYMYIRNLMGIAETANAGASLRLLITNYYHVGFHLVTLFIMSMGQAEIKDIMLILGQIILAATPFSVFFLIKHETKSNSAGIFAVLLAGFGWYMPAHVLDWGKYPALTSLMLIQFVLGLVYLFLRYRDTLSRRKYWGLIAILATGLLVSGFAHSRSLVIFGIVFVACAIAAGWTRLPRVPQLLVLVIVIGGILWEIIYIQSHDVLYLLFDPYGLQSWPVTLSVLFLFGFALKAYPKLTFSAVLALFLMVASLFVPVRIPGFVELTLLDRPFVEMILYLPLSLIGGLGLGGLEGYLLQSKNLSVLTKYAGVLFSGLVVISAILLQYQLYPSDCCIIVGSDDLVAIDWMDKNLPPDGRVAISAVELMVLASDSFQGYVGGDAGIWITPLTDRPTIPFLDRSDFSQRTTIQSLCGLEANYLYIGEIGQTFNDSQIRTQTDWYKILLSMPKAKVYQITGCE